MYICIHVFVCARIRLALEHLGHRGVAAGASARKTSCLEQLLFCLAICSVCNIMYHAMICYN